MEARDFIDQMITSKITSTENSCSANVTRHEERSERFAIIGNELLGLTARARLLKM